MIDGGGEAREPSGCLQRRSEKKRPAVKWKRVLVIVAVLAVAAVGFGFFWPFYKRTHELHLYGVVEIQEVRLASKIGGRVEDTLIKEGEIVNAGRVLVKFEAPELRAQRQQAAARLAQAEADWEKAEVGPREEEKDAARASWDAAQAKMAMLDAGPRPQEIDQARNDLAAAQADLIQWEPRVQRLERLLPTKAASQEDYDTARAMLDRTRAQAKALQSRLNLLLAGTRQEEKDEQRAQVARLDANYRLLKAGTRPEDKAAAAARVEEARGKLAELDASLAEVDVKAPGKCVIEVLAVRKGDVVAPNQPVVRILRDEDQWVKVYVPEPELEKIKLDQQVTVVLDSGRRYPGSVFFIASESEFTPRNIQSEDERRHQVFGVKVRVDNTDQNFKSGMAAQVIIPLAE
jgi:HlyD family secretion protein